MLKTAPSGGIVTDNLTMAQKTVLIGHQPLEPNRAAGVDFTGADADLSAESISEAVTEAGRTVSEDITGIDPA